jgi:hypothetical protein
MKSSPRGRKGTGVNRRAINEMDESERTGSPMVERERRQVVARNGGLRLARSSSARYSGIDTSTRSAKR